MQFNFLQKKSFSYSKSSRQDRRRKSIVFTSENSSLPASMYGGDRKNGDKQSQDIVPPAVHLQLLQIQIFIP